ncbi:MAG: hypothetical protein OXU62_06240 [Gammaproteobacteria bacterium]|nr:hypothetical protein [Gammaproteobacteria bacterium]
MTAVHAVAVVVTVAGGVRAVAVAGGGALSTVIAGRRRPSPSTVTVDGGAARLAPSFAPRHRLSRNALKHGGTVRRAPDLT